MSKIRNQPDEKNTAWTLEEHMSWYGKNFNDGAAKWILENTNSNSILEFGCGGGYYCQYWSDNGVKFVHGIEPEEMDKSCFVNEGCEQFVLDITSQPESEGIHSRYDTIVSIEVMEHVPRQHHTLVFDWLASKNPRMVIFSGARIGQGGKGHIACRSEEDWRSEWTKRGFKFQQLLTNQIRKHSNPRNGNHVKNLQVFTNDRFK